MREKSSIDLHQASVIPPRSQQAEDDLTIKTYVNFIGFSPQFKHLAVTGKTHEEFLPHWKGLGN